MKKLILSMTAAILVAGCAVSESTRTSAVEYAPTEPKSVEILFEKPERPYQVVGYVSGRGGSYGAWVASDADVYQKMREEAAKLGANAILVRADMTAQTVGNAPMKQGNALAIKWTEAATK